MFSADSWIPLHPDLRAILEDQPTRKGFLFAFRGTPKEVSRKVTKLATAAGLTITLHDLRRTARTLMGDLEVPRETAELVLGHVVGSEVEQRYNRSRHEEAKRKALEALARKIASIVDPQPSNVVALRGAAK